MTELEAIAAKMYAERVQERGPAWEQLGSVTKSVWMEMAAATQNDDFFADDNQDFFS